MRKLLLLFFVFLLSSSIIYAEGTPNQIIFQENFNQIGQLNETWWNNISDAGEVSIVADKGGTLRLQGTNFYIVSLVQAIKFYEINFSYFFASSDTSQGFWAFNSSTFTSDPTGGVEANPRVHLTVLQHPSLLNQLRKHNKSTSVKAYDVDVNDWRPIQQNIATPYVNQWRTQVHIKNESGYYISVYNISHTLVWSLNPIDNKTAPGQFDDYNDTWFFMMTELQSSAQDVFFDNFTFYDLSLPKVPSPFFDLTLTDIYDGSSISSFTASIINGTFTETLNTVNGTISFSQTTGNFSLNISPVDYFSKKIHSINISSDLSTTVIQSILLLNASELGTGTVINTFNISVPLQSNTTTNGTAILYLKAGSYNVIGSTSGFIDTTKSITISALETLEESLVFGSTNFTIFANDSFTNISISDFNVTITNEFIDSTINTNTGKVSFSLINGTYNVSIFASGYSIQTINITINQVVENHTFFLFLQNSILMRLLRESDNTLIEDQTMTIDVDNVDNTFQDTFTTTNGTLFLSGLPPSTYRLEPFSTEFSDRRTFFVTLSSGGHINIDMRLLNSTEGKEVTLRVLDFNTGEPISGAVITATKKVNLSDLTVDQAITDDTGIAKLFLKETQQYTLLITHPSYITRIVSLTPTTDDVLTIRLVSGAIFDFTTIFSRFNYLIRPVDSIIFTGNKTFNITVSCTVDYPGCLDYFGIQFNSSLINNITASPGGGTASVFFFVDNATVSYTFNYFVKMPDFDVYSFNFTYFQRVEIITGNQSFVKLLETYGGLFPDWFKPVIAVLIALMVMLVLKRFTEISGTGLAVVGVFVEIFFAIFNWIPRLIMFVIVLIIGIGWLLRETGDT